MTDRGCKHGHLLFVGDDQAGEWAICEECEPIRLWRLYRKAADSRGPDCVSERESVSV